MGEERPTLARKVYFFRIEHFDEFKDKIPGALERIENLPFTDEGRYLVETQSHLRLCAFPETLTYPIKLRFGRTRRDLLPDIERNGKVAELDIAEEAGLIDLCHIVIFSDGHVAAEWNPEGPKMGRLSAYLLEKGNLASAPKFRNLFERDIVDVVRSLDSVRVLDIDLPPDAAALAKEADESLAAAIQATEQLGATKKIGLTLTATQGSGKLKNLALRLAEIIQKRPQERERFISLRATGYDSATSLSRYIDILEDKLVSGELFPRRSSRSRSLDSDEAYRLIQGAYNERKDKLASAAIAGDL